MDAVASASALSAAFAVQRQMAVDRAMAHRHPPVIEPVPDFDDRPAVILDLSPAALLLFGLGPVVVDTTDDAEALLIAELLETTIAVDLTI
jgi:hypothetical protein